MKVIINGNSDNVFNTDVLHYHKDSNNTVYIENLLKRIQEINQQQILQIVEVFQQQNSEQSMKIVEELKNNIQKPAKFKEKISEILSDSANLVTLGTAIAQLGSIIK